MSCILKQESGYYSKPGHFLCGIGHSYCVICWFNHVFAVLAIRIWSSWEWGATSHSLSNSECLTYRWKYFSKWSHEYFFHLTLSTLKKLSCVFSPQFLVPDSCWLRYECLVIRSSLSSITSDHWIAWSKGRVVWQRGGQMTEKMLLCVHYRRS